MFLFIVFVFFPYLKIVEIPSDTQPYALILSFFIFLMASSFKGPLPVMLLLVPMFGSILLGVESGFSLNAIRSITNYTSIFFISFASYYLIRHRNLLDILNLNTVIYIWFAVGIIQLLLLDKFGYSIISNTRTNSTRGVISLAPEPSYYGVICIFLLLINDLIGKNKRLNQVLLIIQIIIFAQSSFIILVLFYYILLKVLVYKSIYYKIIVLSLCIAFILIVFFYVSKTFPDLFSGKRVFLVLSRIVENPQKFILSDASSNNRFFHIFFSIKGFVDNLFFPHGYTAWAGYLNDILDEYGRIAWWISKTRIMSTFGATLFELGFIGLFIPFSINSVIIFAFKKDIKHMIFFLLFINAILLTSIPLALPHISLIIGILCNRIMENT